MASAVLSAIRAWALTGFPHGFDQPRNPGRSIIGGFLHALGILDEAGGKLHRARRAGRHRGIDAAQTGIGEVIEALRLACKSHRGFLRRVALGVQHALKGIGLFFQPREQFIHRDPLAFLARQHEFRARSGGIADGLDLLGLAVELDGRGLRRIGGPLRGVAEMVDLRIQRLARGFQFAAGRFDDRLELCGSPRQQFCRARGNLIEAAGEILDSFTFGMKALRDGFCFDGGAGAGFVELSDAIFERRFQCAHASKGAVEPGGQRVEFAAHGAAQTLGALNRILIG